MNVIFILSNFGHMITYSSIDEKQRDRRAESLKALRVQNICANALTLAFPLVHTMFTGTGVCLFRTEISREQHSDTTLSRTTIHRRRQDFVWGALFHQKT